MNCKKCRLESKDKNLFVKRADRKSGYRNICKKCSNDKYISYSRNFREKKRDIINKVKSSPCLDCGEKYPPHVMDLDHKNPDLKKRSISEFLCKGTLLELELELKKCEPVCSNCHRQRTHDNNHYAHRNSRLE